ncbi:hypothetical protein ASPFODRAFT_54099 [Aspergillus luchuensis CBS 106.47]|uniref:Uncharacterized protein n=1 Tax=Aspergillus luchuensis (strain CBS 106.47) TaxID=1137211 RepID=A0A1M3SZY5_ASPLC|nr:hypothetical protein ASPFODRAFT_54099 [Aspergillus luchuensis CBS 106.47]
MALDAGVHNNRISLLPRKFLLVNHRAAPCVWKRPGRRSPLAHSFVLHCCGTILCWPVSKRGNLAAAARRRSVRSPRNEMLTSSTSHVLP